MNTEKMIRDIQRYAAENKMYLETEGEVGFGRECVGLINNNHYVYYGYESVPGDYESEWVYVEEAAPPKKVKDAYHKTECIAVLGRGDEAIKQLWHWVNKLKKNNVTIEIQTRTPSSQIDLLFNGPSRPVFKVKE